MNKSVIFDMDGVLLDTERIYQHFWHIAAGDFGVDLTDERALTLRSLDGKLASGKFEEWFGDAGLYVRMREHRKEMMNAYLEAHPAVAKPGVRETISFLSERGIQYAIATATNEVRARECLEMAGISDLFDVIISAKSLPRGKPYPDVYQNACAAIGRECGDCFAVEDSPNGLLSARRAGCITVFVPDMTPYSEELADRTDYALKKLTDLCGII